MFLTKPISPINKLEDSGIKPTAYFNGFDITGSTSFTSSGTAVPDNLGVLHYSAANQPAIEGARLTGGVYYDTALDGSQLIPRTTQRTRTGNAGFTVFTTDAYAQKRYNPQGQNPLTMKGYLNEPARSTYAKLPASPATQTTTSLATGTYCLWVNGTGSFQASAGTAAAIGGWGGAATEGNPVTFTVTTAGTVVLTKTGTVTWVQLELGAFPTSRIDNPTSAASVSRAATVLTYPVAGHIKANEFALSGIFDPKATGQSGVYLWASCINNSNFIAVGLNITSVSLVKKEAGVVTETAFANHTHKKDEPFQWIAVFNATMGMQVAVRKYSGGAWSAWTNGAQKTTTAGKASASLGITHTIGCLNSINQVTGNIGETVGLVLPDGLSDPLSYAKAKLKTEYLYNAQHYIQFNFDNIVFNNENIYFN